MDRTNAVKPRTLSNIEPANGVSYATLGGGCRQR